MKLQELIDETRRGSFTKDVIVSDAEVLGVLIAEHFKWSGEPIIDAFLSALTDANFHSLREKIEEISKEHLK